MSAQPQPLSFQERLRQARMAALGKTEPLPRPAKMKVVKPTKAEKKAQKEAEKLKNRVDQFLTARHRAQDAEKKFKTRDTLTGKISLWIDSKTTVFIDPDKDPAEVLERYHSIIRKGLKK